MDVLDYGCQGIKWEFQTFSPLLTPLSLTNLPHWVVWLTEIMALENSHFMCELLLSLSLSSPFIYSRIYMHTQEHPHAHTVDIF